MAEENGRGATAPPKAAPSFKDALAQEVFAGQKLDVADPVDQALLQRPAISFRLRLILAFSLFFLLALGITLWSMQVLSTVQQKILFLEVADDFKLELQQVRRFEKNFLLYGTNLEDALEHVEQARRLARKHRQTFLQVMRAEDVITLEENLQSYAHLLSSLPRDNSDLQQQRVRKHGANLLVAAQGLVKEERRLVHEMLGLTRRVPFFFLLVLFLLGALLVWFLGRQVLATLGRFLGYTERIAWGDFSPITPARKYRDEFSTLALALNRMTRELDRHHRILVESHKQRAMGNLVAGVAHELNNPLNNILLTASLFRDDYQELGDSEKEEMLADIIGQSERARQIVRNLLDFARESETNLEPLAVKRLLEETLQLVSNQLRVKKIKLEMDIPDELPAVHGDRQLLQQVFMNIIINAVDALPERGRITISSDTGKKEGFLAIDIIDNGPGIPEHIINRLFEPFFTTKPKGQGTGLGLSVSRGIVRKLGGYLFVESELDRGATFSVLLPITSVPATVGSGRT